MPLVKLVNDLIKNQKTIKFFSSCSMNKKEQWDMTYWQFTVDIYALLEHIRNQADIAEIDVSTGQNLLHFVFEQDLFQYSKEQGSQYHLFKKDTDGVLTSFNTNNRSWKDYHDNYEKTLKAGKLKIVRDVAESNTSQLFKAIASLFHVEALKQAGDEALMKDLLTLDNQGNTPLFYAFKKKRCTVGGLLFERIGKFDEPCKEKLMQVRNENGRSILHESIAHYSQITAYPIRYFGENAVRRAFWIVDNKGNTPFHEIFLDKITYLNMVEFIVKLVKTPETYRAPDCHGSQVLQNLPENPYTIEKLFNKNNDGCNPLHLACNRPAKNSDDFQVINILLGMLPLESAVNKILEFDNLGCTPLHYALQNGQVNIVNVFLELLQAQKIQIRSANPSKSFLHYACEYGNSQMLQKVMAFSGLRERYQLLREIPKLTELINSNANIQNKKELVALINLLPGSNKLLDCLNYFESDFSNLSFYNIQLQDFYHCVLNIGNKIPLPPLSPWLETNQPSASLFQEKSPYFHLRKNLQNITEKEVEEFKNLIVQMSYFVNSDPDKTPPPIVQLTQKLCECMRLSSSHGNISVSEPRLDRTSMENKNALQLQAKPSNYGPPSYFAHLKTPKECDLPVAWSLNK